MKQTLIAFVGAIVGGAIGFFGYKWLLGQNLYGMVFPGGLLGLGAGMGKTRMVWPSILFSLSAVLLGLFTEWWSFPMIDDGSFGFFLLHLYWLKPATLLFIGLGGAIAFWVPFRRIEPRVQGANNHISRL